MTGRLGMCLERINVSVFEHASFFFFAIADEAKEGTESDEITRKHLSCGLEHCRGSFFFILQMMVIRGTCLAPCEAQRVRGGRFRIRM